MELEEVMAELEERADNETREKIEYYSIDTTDSYGISITDLRELAKKVKENTKNLHHLALELWDTGVLEARMLAAMIDKPEKVTEEQMENWVRDFNSWALCDIVCQDLFSRTSYAERKIEEWASGEREFVKRAGFSLLAKIAVYRKEAKDEKFESYFSLIKEQADDGRKYVKKAISWALREIGKRNKSLNEKAIQIAEELREKDSKPAGWIASEVLRELRSEEIQSRFK